MAGAALSRLKECIAENHSNVISEFRNIDKDGSGTLTLEEIVEAFSGLGVHLTPDGWGEVMGMLDKDNNDTINYSEFMEGICNCTGESPRAAPKTARDSRTARTPRVPSTDRSNAAEER